MKILIFISLLFIPSFSSAQNVSGNVKDFHFNNPLEVVSVTLKNNSSGEIVGTDSTDATGNYSIDYIIVGVNEDNALPSDFYLSNPYPQPFNPSTRIDFSAPRQSKFTARIYNIIGQLVYTRDFTINAGNHSFNISGLGSAGVYLFNLSSDNFTSSQKLLLLDGGSGNINVELTGSDAGRMNKPAYEDLLIEFQKDGYFEKDTVINWQMNLIVDAEVSQIPQPGNGNYSGNITTNPGGGNGAGLNVKITNIQNNEILSEIVSDEFGNWDSSVPFLFRTNGVDTLYNLTGVRITLSGEFIDTASNVVQPFQQNYFWEANVNLVTQFISASYNIHLTNLQTGENVPNADITVRDQDQNLLFTIITAVGGNASQNYQVGYYTNGIDTLWNVTQLNSTITKDGYNELNFSNNFQQNLNLEKELSKIPFAVNFSLNPWNILGFQVTDPVMLTIGQDSTRTHTVQTDGKIHFNYSLFNDVVEKDVKLVQTNPEYNPYLMIRRINQKPEQLNLFENNISGGVSYQNVPDTLIINLDVMNTQGNANLVLEPSYVYHPHPTLGYISTMSDTLRSFIGQYPGANGTVRWSTTGVNDSTLKIFNWTWEENSGNPVPPNEVAQVEEILDTILTYTTHPIGDTLFHYDRFTIDSLQDPNWVTWTQPPISNLLYTRHRNQTPSNLLIIHPENGFARYGSSGYPVGSPKILKADEMTSSFTGMDDNLYGSSIGIVFNQDASLNDVGIYLIYKNWMSNPGRRVK